MMMRETGNVAQDFEWFSIKTRLIGVKARRGYTDGSIVKQRDGRTDILRSETFTEYAKVVKQYTSRKMSYASDTLKSTCWTSAYSRSMLQVPNQGRSSGNSS
jgi:hypothetical protein